MSSLASVTGLQSAMTQQKIAVEMMRQAAEMQAAIVDMLTTVAGSGRGVQVDISA